MAEEREARIRGWANTISSALVEKGEISVQELSARFKLDARMMEEIVREALTKGYLRASLERGVLRPAAPAVIPAPKAAPVAPAGPERWAQAIRSALEGREELTLYELSLSLRLDSKRMEKIVHELLEKGLLPEMVLNRGSVRVKKSSA